MGHLFVSDIGVAFTGRQFVLEGISQVNPRLEKRHLDIEI